MAATSGLRGETETQCLQGMMPGMAIALQEMTEGERRLVWVPAGLSFRPEDGPPQSGPPLTVDVEVVKVLRAPAAPENLLRPPDSAVRTRLGVRIEWLSREKAGGAHPSMASRLTVHYTGWTAAGEVFETTAMSGHPAEVLLGTALPGWRDALPLVSAGDKVRLWIPAAAAFGEKPPQRAVPAGDLVYDVELVSFR